MADHRATAGVLDPPSDRVAVGQDRVVSNPGPDRHLQDGESRSELRRAPFPFRWIDAQVHGSRLNELEAEAPVLVRRDGGKREGHSGQTDLGEPHHAHDRVGHGSPGRIANDALHCARRLEHDLDEGRRSLGAGNAPPPDGEPLRHHGHGHVQVRGLKKRRAPRRSRRRRSSRRAFPGPSARRRRRGCTPSPRDPRRRPRRRPPAGGRDRGRARAGRAPFRRSRTRPRSRCAGRLPPAARPPGGSVSHRGPARLRRTPR